MKTFRDDSVEFTATVNHHTSDRPLVTDTVLIDGAACDFADRLDQATRIFRFRHGKDATITITPIQPESK